MSPYPICPICLPFRPKNRIISPLLPVFANFTPIPPFVGNCRLPPPAVATARQRLPKKTLLFSVSSMTSMAKIFPAKTFPFPQKNTHFRPFHLIFAPFWPISGNIRVHSC